MNKLLVYFLLNADHHKKKEMFEEVKLDICTYIYVFDVNFILNFQSHNNGLSYQQLND